MKKRLIVLVLCNILIFSCCTIFGSSETTLHTIIDIDDNKWTKNIGYVNGDNFVKTGGIFSGTGYYTMSFTEDQPELFFSEWISSYDTMDTSKKYIFHGEFYPDFDTPTGYVKNLYLGPEGTIDKDGESVSPKNGLHPSQNDYRYYSYYYKDAYTDLYTTGYFNGYIDENLKATQQGGTSVTIESNEFVLKTNEWNNFELLVSKPPENSRFSVYPYVHGIFGNDVVGKNLRVRKAVMQELSHENIVVQYQNESIAGKTIKTKQDYELTLGAEVYNQFGTSLGFKDKEGRVLEPLQFKIYNSANELVSTSNFESCDTSAPIYVETRKNSYKLKAQKDGREFWTIPTYDFTLRTAPDVEIGVYRVEVSLQNKDIYNSEEYISFNLSVLRKDQMCGDEKEPHTVLWLNGEDEENRIGYGAEFCGDYGNGYVISNTVYSDVSFEEGKKYIYHADYYSPVDLSFDLSMNGETQKIELEAGKVFNFIKVFEPSAETAEIIHTLQSGNKLYADNIYLQELSLSEIELACDEKEILQGGKTQFYLEAFNQFGTKDGFSCDDFNFEYEEAYIGITLEQDGYYVLRANDGAVLKPYKITASISDNTINNSDKKSSFEIKVNEKKFSPSTFFGPETLLWLNGEDEEIGNLKNSIKDIGINRTKGYKLTLGKDGENFIYLSPWISCQDAEADPTKKYIYHCDYYPDFELTNSDTTNNWIFNSTFEVSGVNEADNEDYRYYSYYKTPSGEDLFVSGSYDGVVQDDLTAVPEGWPPVSDMLTLKTKSWNSVDALISKHKGGEISVYSYIFKNNPDFYDGIENKNVFVDNIAVQELALEKIVLSENNFQIKRGETKNFSANVYNQFGSELGFKDREGRILEPLLITVYDINGNEVAFEEFSLNKKYSKDELHIKTDTLEYTLNSGEKWVYPTYDFTLYVPEHFPTGEYRAVVKLQHTDIYGFEKHEEFTFNVIEDEKTADCTIFGDAEIKVPDHGNISYTVYSSNIENGKWSLGNNYSGISISSDGVLTVMPFADTGSITLIYSCENNGLKYLTSKKIAVLPKNKFELSDDASELELSSEFELTDKLMICAGYDKNDKLIFTDSFSYNSQSGSFKVSIPENTAEIKTYIWDFELSPVSEVNLIKTDKKIYNLYVSQQGDDTNDGSFENPLRTFNGARDKIREIKKLYGYPEKGFRVNIREGYYNLTSPFVLNTADSGKKDSPIIYSAYEDEKVVISGGAKLPSDSWKITEDIEALSKIPEKAHGKVYEIDLGALGYTRQQLGEMNYPGTYSPYSFYKGDNYVAAQPSELFCDNEPMTIARYPNNDYIYINNVYEEGTQCFYTQTEKIPFTIGYEDVRTENWLNAKYIKMCGYWSTGWGVSTVDIDKINTVNKTITSKQPVPFGVTSYSTQTEGGRYYVFNLLEELDSPGEYYTDLDNMKLYYYPKKPIEECDIEISIMDNYLTVLNNVSNVEFENIKFTSSRYSGIQLNNCFNCKISNSEICNLGKIAVHINEGQNNSVENCKIYNTDGGVDMCSKKGRAQLIKSNNSVIGNEFYRYSRISPCNVAAILIQGCGNYVANNTIHDSPHLAINFVDANENIVEYNEIYDVLKDTSDAGAIYYGMDWSMRGNIIRYNYIHDLGNNQVNIHGIYFDGTGGGAEVYSNIIGGYFGTGVYVNGSRDVFVHDNIFYNCTVSGLLMTYVTNMEGSYDGNEQIKWLLLSPYRSDIWREKYPLLYTLLEDDPYLPKGNRVCRNISVSSSEDIIADAVYELSNIENSYHTDEKIIDTDNGFVCVDFDKIRNCIPQFEVFDVNNIGIK